MYSHSIDGSAFESTQHVILRQIAIDPVTKKLVSKIFDKLKQNLWFLNNVSDMEQLERSFLE